MRKWGVPELLNFGVEFADAVMLRFVNDHELSDFPKRDVARLTPLVRKSPSTDAQVGHDPGG